MIRRILMGILIFMMPLYVHADELVVSCPSEVSINSEFTCKISGKTNASINSLRLMVKGDNFKFVSFDPAGNWQGDGLNGDVQLYTDSGKTNNFDIGTVKFKSNDKLGSVIADTIIFYDEIGKSYNVSSVNKIVNIKSNTNNSSSNVNTNTNNDDNKVLNNNTTNNNNNSVTDNNNNNNNVTDNGTNNSDDNSNVNIDDKDDNENQDIKNTIYLKDLDIVGYELNFNKEKYEYTLKIGKEDKLNIIPILENNNYTYIIRNNSNLINGSVIEVEVVSKFNDVNNSVYRIKVVKDEVMDEDSDNDYTMMFIIIIAILVIINVVRIVLSVRRSKNEE